MSAPKQPAKPKAYRFALYGASGSGKTAFLAALAMNRVSYHPNFTCTRVPLAETLAADPKGRTSRTQARLAALQEGKKWLDRAVETLEHEQMLPPNPSDHPDMVFEFDLCTNKRTYRLEFLDYAGELVHSTQSANDNAKRLRAKLKKMDALLVLAPVPWPENDYKSLDEDLSAVRETFMLLRGERGESALQLPVALLFGKWDRRSRLEYRTPENETKEMVAFLAQYPPPPHKTLYNALQGAIANPENFAAFPVSALGECSKLDLGNGRLADGPPASFKPLHAFGLEDPLVWAAERRDRLDLREMESRVRAGVGSSVGLWKPWPFPLHGLSSDATALTRRFPDTDPQRAQAQRLEEQVKGALWRRRTTSAIVVLAGLLGGEMAWDGKSYAQVAHTLGNPDASAQDLDRAKQWLESYTESGVFRHILTKAFVLEVPQAESLMKRLHEGRDDERWSKILGTGGAEQVKLAEDYLADYPNGSHRYEAEALVAKYTAQQEWSEFERMYQAAMDDGRTVEAAEMLVNRGGDDPRLEAIKRRFEATALDDIDRRVGPLLQNLSSSSFEQAAQWLAQVDRWPPALRSDGGIARFRQLQQKMKAAQDRWLYDQAKTYRGIDAIQRYLDDAPIGKMKPDLENYLKWLETKTGEQVLTLHLTHVRWGSDASSEDPITIRVYRDNNKVIEIAGLESDANKTEDLFGSKSDEFIARLDDQVEIRAEAVDLDWIGGDDDMGTGARKLRVRELQGLELPIKTEDMTNTLYFHLKGLPQEPELGAWKGE